MNPSRLAAALIALVGCSPQSPPAAGPLIVIVADCPFISREDFEATVQSQHDKAVSEESVNTQYEEFLRDVAAVQAEQFSALSNLIQEHNLKGVYLESLTDENADDFRLRVQQLTQVDLDRAQRRSGKSENPEVIAQAGELLRTYEDELLRIGAVGRLLMWNLLDEVLPLHNDSATDQTRAAEMAQRLIAGGPVVVAVLVQVQEVRDEIATACPKCRVEFIAPERLDKLNAAQR